jgi:hypothetical protein
MSTFGRFYVYEPHAEVQEDPVRWLLDFKKKRVYSQNKGGSFSESLFAHRKRTYGAMLEAIEEVLELANDSSSGVVPRAMDETTYEKMEKHIQWHIDGTVEQ